LTPAIDPPRLRACATLASSRHALLPTFGCFGWSPLGAAHEEMAKRFPGVDHVGGAAQFEGAEWKTAVTGPRLLCGASLAFDCTLESIGDAAENAVVTGLVAAVRQTQEAGAPVRWPDVAWATLP